MSTRVLLADDHQLFRQGLRTLLTSEGIDVVSDVQNGLEAVEQWPQVKADVAILDLSMPELNGLEAAREILRLSPQAAAILLTMYDENSYVLEALQAGVGAYVLKTKAAEDLLNAIREVKRGGVFFSSGVSRDVVGACFSRRTNPADPLTERERQVVQLVAEGKTTKELAAMLSISVKTADCHRQRIMKKLDAHSTAAIVRYAVRRGLIEA